MWKKLIKRISRPFDITLLLITSALSTLFFFILFQTLVIGGTGGFLGAGEEYHLEIDIVRDSVVVDTFLMSSTSDANWFHEYDGGQESVEISYSSISRKGASEIKSTRITAEVFSKDVFIDSDGPLILKSILTKMNIGIHEGVSSAHLICDKNEGCKSLWALNVRTKK